MFILCIEVVRVSCITFIPNVLLVVVSVRFIMFIFCVKNWRISYFMFIPNFSTFWISVVVSVVLVITTTMVIVFCT